MDELTLLRSTRDQEREPRREALANGRAALRTKMDDETAAIIAAPLGAASTRTSQDRRRRRVVAWTGFSAVGAASLAVALVATDVLGFADWNGGSDPAAASVLRSAAASAMEISDPAIGSGQYLLVQSDGVFSAAGALEAEVERIRAEGGDVESAEAVALLEKEHSELYVPADLDSVWVWIQCMREPFQTFGPKSEAFAEEMKAVHDRYDASIIRQFPGGNTPGGDSFAGYSNGPRTSRDWSALPRDSRQLLDRIYELNGDTGPSRDGQALQWIISALRYGTAPADVRAALYKAAAEIPGVEITEDQATLNGAVGIAIGRVETTSNVRFDLIIDPRTGQFIGEREVTLDGFAGIPAGTATSWTTVTTSVVDAAPTDVAACNQGDQPEQ